MVSMCFRPFGKLARSWVSRVRTAPTRRRSSPWVAPRFEKFCIGRTHYAKPSPSAVDRTVRGGYPHQGGNMATLDSTAVPDYGRRLRLDGKHFIVLGAGQGMGRQTSHALHQMGAGVFCVDQDSERAAHGVSGVTGIAYGGERTRGDAVGGLAPAAETQMGAIDGFADII